ncbi:uncharacterized protein EKO05_0003508 [Ascochyta rabiei]|uniref:Uncharacterized protein n=1 Tax=Didymella rabiei TaxID=5454 RepID=A0A163GEJ2_DIDRA|nr:uncharacterized protein EKO05_0003508 [Ascochyta rabiei]KZM24819.1 hypothetical protein ST47_g4040 [Ascochyta rabiei]UPX12978.1 hypothetical protein EKO05_0003508 [Ascochyta rabiei]
MLNIHRMASTSFCSWGDDFIEPESESIPPTNLTPEQSFESIWVNTDEESTKAPVSKPSSPISVYSDLRCNTPTTDPDLNGPIFSTESHFLDTVTFSPHATHLLPSEPNGTWRNRTSHAIKNPSEAATTLREVLEQYTHEFDVAILLQKLEQAAEDSKDDMNDWLNQTFADHDLVEMHHQVRQLVPVLSMPSMRQLDSALDAVTEIAQSLRKHRSQPDLLNDAQGDKYAFARIISQKARHALVEQGICKNWQFMGEELADLNSAMPSALMHTFVRIQRLYENLPLFQAKPLWLANHPKKIWRLELDVGIVGVEVGPESDRSLVELGSVDTGFELPESSGCISIVDLDRQVQTVEDEWQLLES